MMNRQMVQLSFRGAAASAILTLVCSCQNPTLNEINPCLVSSVSSKVIYDNTENVDLLFVVDKSGSMLEEQDKIRKQFRRVIQVLTSGDKNPDDNGGELEIGKDFMPVKNLHLGVVSTDIGLPGIADPDDFPDPSGCQGIGDDAWMLHEPHRTITGLGSQSLDCADSYPPFLTYFRDQSDIERISTDFQCIAGIGAEGCGYEQQLEAGLKALWPSRPNTRQLVAFDSLAAWKAARIFFLGGDHDAVHNTGGHGDSPQHASFLRGVPYNPEEPDRQSLLAIIIVSDENDCSMGAQGNMNILAKSSASVFPAWLASQKEKADRTNLRCFYDNELPANERNRYPVERYIAGFKALRGLGNESYVVFGAIVGVPTDAIREDVPEAELDSYYQSILDHPAMQERVDERYADRLASACVLTKDEYAQNDSVSSNEYITDAKPGRRFVEVAREFGKNGVVRSICEPDFKYAIDAFVGAISAQLRGVCMPRTLRRDVNGMVNCDVIWEMPIGKECNDPAYSKYGRYLSKPTQGPAVNEKGQALCKVNQIAILNREAGEGDDPFAALEPNRLGWYYDDFSKITQNDCTKYKQRIAFLLSPSNRNLFAPDQTPPDMVTVNLQCINEMHTWVTADKASKKLGDPCQIGEDKSDNCGEGKLICHPQSLICVQTCSSNVECPPSWVCDKRDQTIKDSASSRGTGEPICINPTCGE